MDMDSEKALLSEVANIINDSAKSLGDVPSEKLRHFIHIEQSMFDAFGFDDTDGRLFQMTMVANTTQEVKDYRDTHAGDAPIIKLSNETDDEVNRAMRVQEVANGDMFDLLADKYAALSFAQDDNGIGIIIRFTGKCSKILEGRPSEQPDAQAVVMTMLIDQHNHLSSMRTIDDPNNPVRQESTWEDYIEGQFPLLDAVRRYFHFPRMLKSSDKEMFDAVVADYKASNDKKQNPNNKGDIQ